MATSLPAKLKIPEVQRLAHRAAQLEKVRPIVTYWCEYSILQYILERELHTTDEECTQYAIRLMDKLEQYKASNPTNDAVIDDVAAKAYVESFALETFDRADKSQRMNTVSLQTADTFQAAITFMDLLSIWDPLEPEIVAKKKFAKFHAVRIAKAIKAGEDPNSSNPAVEPSPAQPDVATNDSIENELRELEKQHQISKEQAPTFGSVSESRVPSRPQSSAHIGPGAAPILPAGPSTDHTAGNEPDVSPIEGPGQTHSRTGSIGGGYFPSIPSAPSNMATTPLGQGPLISSPPAPTDPAVFYTTAPSQPSAAATRDLETSTPNQVPLPKLNETRAQPSSNHIPKMTAPVSTGISTPAQHTPTAIPIGGYNADDDAIADATKHARWAISALNFEDVNTAVKEFKIALRSLGAT